MLIDSSSLVLSFQQRLSAACCIYYYTVNVYIFNKLVITVCCDRVGAILGNYYAKRNVGFEIYCNVSRNLSPRPISESTRFHAYSINGETFMVQELLLKHSVLKNAFIYHIICLL